MPSSSSSPEVWNAPDWRSKVAVICAFSAASFA